VIGVFAITVGMVAAALVPPGAETGFLNRSLTVGGQTFRYQVYVPSSYDPSRAWPVVLFLHGSGERGSDGIRQTSVGLGAAIRAYPERFPAIVVFPQAPEYRRWAGEAESAALEALDRAVAEFHGDPERLYLVGISMGGRGALEIASHSPGRFAAAIAVCGWVVPPKEIADLEPATTVAPGTDPYAEMAKTLKDLPIRLYHGSQDTIVPASESRRLTLALHELGADAHYNEFAGVGHAAWDKAFSDPEVWKWLFSKRRGATAPPVTASP
jgi:predicted peptidase